MILVIKVIIVKKENNILDSMFYKQNMKIKNNSLKVYSFVLIISLMVVFIKGIN